MALALDQVCLPLMLLFMVSERFRGGMLIVLSHQSELEGLKLAERGLLQVHEGRSLLLLEVRHGGMIDRRVDVIEVVLVDAALLVERDLRVVHQHVVDVIQQEGLVLKALDALELGDLGAKWCLALIFLCDHLDERRANLLLALRGLSTCT